MAKFGSKVTFSKRKVELYGSNGSITTLIQPHEGGLYLLQSTHPFTISSNFSKLMCAYAIDSSLNINIPSKLWQYKLGHANS
jgi:hypothetical protein